VTNELRSVADAYGAEFREEIVQIQARERWGSGLKDPKIRAMHLYTMETNENTRRLAQRDVQLLEALASLTLQGSSGRKGSLALYWDEFIQLPSILSLGWTEAELLESVRRLSSAMEQDLVFRQRLVSIAEYAYPAPAEAAVTAGLEERVQETLSRLAVEAGSQLQGRVAIIGPSFYQEWMPFLPALIERALGSVQEQIFLDPGDADGRAEWAARVYARQDLPTVSYFGDDQEFESFSSFGRTAGLTVLRSPESGSSNPVLFVLRLLEWIGLPTGTLSSTQREDLERDLKLLIQA
jgi:hypothetical protein